MEKSGKGEKVASELYRGIIFVLPLIYSIQTRFLRRSKLGIIIWATEYFIPVFLVMALIDLDSINIFYAIMLILSVYHLYEIGYIQNDCETIKRESSPTIRLTRHYLLFYEENKNLIYILRVLIGIFFSWWIYSITGNSVLIISMWLVVPYFFVYNMIRGRINLYMLFFLMAYRYCFPLCVYCAIVSSDYMWTILVLMLFAYPFPTFIEICADGKGNPPEKWTLLFLKSFDERFVFRIKYYSFMLVICIVLFLLLNTPYVTVILPLYFLLDRFPQLYMKKMGDK